MSRKVFFGQNDLRFFYYRYKDSSYYSISVILATIVVCLLLIFMVIIPQAGVYFSIRREAEVIRSKIGIINENINFMKNVDKSLLDSQLQIVTRALPVDKDFSGVINAITDAAVRSGVSVADYSFRLDEKETSTGGVKNNLSVVKITVDIKGSTDGGRRFLTEIYEKLPLVDVTNVRGNSDSLTVGMHFFYKDLPKISFKEDEPITKVADSKQALIDKLSSWQTTSRGQEIETPDSSASAPPLF